MAEPDLTFMHWLGELPADKLARILSNRPEGPRPPWPRNLRALAVRLADPACTTAAVRRLPAPAAQALRAMAILPAGAGRGELARLLGVDVTDEDLDSVMIQLAECALAWESPSGRILAAPNVLAGWHHPLGLGTSASDLLDERPFHKVKEIARRLGFSLGGGKQAVTERMLDLYQDHDALDSVIARGPAGLREVLAPFVHDGPAHYTPGVSPYYRADEPVTPERWATERGLLFAHEWSWAEMPREVTVTLRGPDWHAPFTPIPPQVKTLQGDPAAIDKGAATAAGHILERAGALLDHAAKTPVAVLKAGGVGQREVKRLARELRCSIEEVRVLLEVLYAAGLLPLSSAGHVPHLDAAPWSAASDAIRLSRLLEAWWSTDCSPLRRDEGTWPAVLSGPAEDGEVAAAVRTAALTVLAGLPAGAEAADLTAAVAWRCPLYPQDLVEEFLASTLAEARLLGLVVNDAASNLGRSLVDGDLETSAGGMVAVVRQVALFGTDLTAVVTGPPTADLARLLDRVADRETRENASVWRFSWASVRRALDNGFTAPELLAALAEVTSAELPQPLRYLINDVARRHGEVAVTDVACVVHATDDALLAEVAGHRKLARLGLRVLTPTVLTSPVPADATVAVLREAGYAPAPASPDGAPTIERSAPSDGPAAQPADVDEDGLHQADRHITVDLDELAIRLLRAPSRPPVSDEPAPALIARHCSHLPFEARFALDYLVRFGHSTRVEATNSDGETGAWTLSHGELDGEVLDAWCDSTADYQRMKLSSITTVS